MCLKCELKAQIGSFNQENLRKGSLRALVLIVEEHIRVHLHVHAGEGVVAVAAGLQAAAQRGGHTEQLPGRQPGG